MRAGLTTCKEKQRERPLKNTHLLYLFGGMFTFGPGESHGFTYSFYLYRLIGREE